jgi:hypothetical protein
MASAPVLPPNRHVEFKKGGWGAAIVTVIATVATFLTAWAIHERTYREPTDVMMRQMGGDAGHGGGGGEAHGAAGHGAEGHAAAPAANAGGQTGGGAAAPAPAHGGGH